MADIFISYRREDTQGIAGRVFEHLKLHYGEQNVFIDIHRIPVGSDLRDQIRKMLDRCAVFIAVVGPKWLVADRGRVRISDENDWVHIEIAAALAKKVPLIPVLIDGTKMPRAEKLPEDIRDFVFRTALNLNTGIDFENHMQRLIKSLDEILASKKSAGFPLPENTSPGPSATTSNKFGKDVADVGSRTEEEQSPRLRGPQPVDDIVLAPRGATAISPNPVTWTFRLPSHSGDIFRGLQSPGRTRIAIFFVVVLASTLALTAYKYGIPDSFWALFRPKGGDEIDTKQEVVLSAPPDSSRHSRENGEKAALQYVNQGWSMEDRQTFYTTSQGSHMIPYLWFKALRRLDVDEPFGADQLARFGYLANEKSKTNPEGLPVGFVIDGDAGTGFFGMTCAACHTAEIEYPSDGITQRLRIDGAPATTDFQSFLKELTATTRETLNNVDRFDKFARAVLGNGYSVKRSNELRTDFAAWVKQWGDFMDKSLPASPWGPGRLDAFGMIFNRVAAKDLGIEANFKVADAPVSYPFLWNASRQDRTQWNGGVPNGLYINALSRNSGEVFGVFADFSPGRLTDTRPPLIDYGKSSIKFAGLQALEEKIVILKPPPWPWPSKLRRDLVDKGRIVFAKECGGCHEEKPLPAGTWLTPVQAVGTDPKMFDNAERSSQTGILAGTLSPNPPGSTLADPATSNEVLATVVVGALINEAFPPPPRFPNPNSGVWQAIRKDLTITQPDPLDSSANENLKAHVRDRLANIFKVPGPPHAYEARVLHGIWATAPYLHNGSVPNLWELLTPPAQRKPFFMVGSRRYDPVNVGYVTDESPFKDGKLVVSGSDVQPGNANSGHDFGTKLSADEKWQLIEYLKQL